MGEAEGAALIDGKLLAARVIERVGEARKALLAATAKTPGLAVVILGEDAASQLYVRSKGRQAEACGFLSRTHALPAETSEADLLGLVASLNADPDIHGILVQMPLPGHIDAKAVVAAVDPAKDVDGFHPLNAGRLATGDLADALVPCTPAGVLVLVKSVRGPDLAGLDALVIGRSGIVGRPVAQLLLAESCTVTIAHSRTSDLAACCARAALLVAAVGRPGLVRGEWVKPGATVIDVGINRVPAPERGEGATRLVGDVAFEAARHRAGAITPVPGGVGPMTIAMLMANTVKAAARSLGRPEIGAALDT